MSEVPPTETVGPANTLSDKQWLDRMKGVADELGFHEPLGPDHSALYFDRAGNLLVTFETTDAARAQSDGHIPEIWRVAERHDWSQLCIMAHSETWFRHDAIYTFFDILEQSGFFDEFDRVIFYGCGSCGYGASALSVAAPGATVIALQPQATLDPRVSEWDRRYLSMRRTSFTDRYGYAPDMIEAAAAVYLLYDPANQEDAIHAALFTKPHVHKLRCRHLDGGIETFLIDRQLLDALLQGAMDDTLSPAKCHRLFRARRDYPPFVDRLRTAIRDRQTARATGREARR